MKKKEQLLKAVQALGYQPKADGDGDIMFRYEMKTLYLLLGDPEEPFCRMILPQFYDVAEGEEATMLAACNKVVREVKVVKVFLDETFKTVSASCEFYYTDDSLSVCLKHSMELMGVVRSVFDKVRRELAE